MVIFVYMYNLNILGSTFNPCYIQNCYMYNEQCYKEVYMYYYRQYRQRSETGRSHNILHCLHLILALLKDNIKKNK